eukprot:TRINITY_DN146_c0_g1_i10.p1 TRINITY_DN146_c0_g1~~TRINITY_DN146_c0_g1_i10.p1  ORF type:complete len:220 (+),score=68.08 TRINITY_DN146_c0_g1_i10:147-806(+)
MAEASITLGYWGIQGLAEPIVKLLEYLGLKYQVKAYTSPEEWAADKATLNTPFPNLPYLKVGDKTLTESEAIAYFLVFHANRTDLFGANNDERVQATAVRGVVSDVTRDFVAFIMDASKHAEQDKYFEEKIHPRLARLNAFAAGKKHIIGDNLNLVDFALFHALYILGKMDSKVLDNYPNLQNIINNFNAIPQINAYHASDAFKNKPLLPPTAAYKFRD